MPSSKRSASEKRKKKSRTHSAGGGGRGLARNDIRRKLNMKFPGQIAGDGTVSAVVVSKIRGGCCALSSEAEADFVSLPSATFLIPSFLFPPHVRRSLPS